MAQTGQPIETVYVSVEADIAKLLTQTKSGVSKVEKELRTVHKAVTASEREFELLKKTIDAVAKKSKVSFKEAGVELKKAFDAKGVKVELQDVNRAVKELEKEGKKSFLGINMEAVKFATILSTVQMGIQAVVRVLGDIMRAGINAFKQITKAAIATNIQFESYVTQFTTLLGSAEAAQQRIKDLTIFAVKTPFELPGIVEASRVLQVFGGDTLATGDNLTMVGDIAAGVGREFSEVALWIGRMYDAMQSGQPFGLAASRLQVMGAMTGQARTELERLQAEGATGAELWERFNELVGRRWAGNMDRLSGTLAGVISNLQDFATNLLRVAGEPLFEELRDDAKRLLDLLEERSDDIEAIAVAFGEVAANVVDFLATGLFEKLESLDTSTIIDITEGLWDAAENARTLLEIIMLLGQEVKPLEAIAWALNKVNAAFELAIPTAAKFAAATTDDIDVLERLDQIMAQHDERIRQHAEATDEDTAAIQRNATALMGQVAAEEASEQELDILMSLATQMIDATDQMNQQIEQLDLEHYQRLGDIVRKSSERRYALIQQYEERRQDAIDRANEQLEDLEEETARRRAELEADYRTSERRATEDFQREMARLQQRYIDNLADAVKNRDARAIVDLRRQYNRERQERTEDFQTRRQREREDYETRLRELAENEARRRHEIQQSLAKQLADLKKSHQKALAELQKSQQQQILAENAAYNMRRAQLQQALAKRLADIAKELADEETLNAESAQRILETLNTVFGVGGNIDKLMEAFAARRRQKMIVSVTFQPQGALATGGGQPGYKQPGMGGTTYGGSYQHGGSVIARRPTIAQFGEVPELATFTPLSKLGSLTTREERATSIDMNLNLSGSAPPGIRSGDRDQIAGVLLNALRESGAMRKR